VWDVAHEEKRSFSHQGPLMHSLPSMKSMFFVIWQAVEFATPLSVLTQLFFLRIIKAQDNNDTDADALDRVSASCIFRNERERCRQKV